ncbi:DUF2238 domain-containing protein [Rhodohalobacter sulfatireducens]|uniref:DUF2238 domain-containing protein n=1 Tax=Rhodohalobacter sulfatireducens TaxID=2911366 RepID=A0ABS9KC98_9BACT|nr:DUF2238 domain-containing protein [Rhodohalobacter sulfatireducens]MCG2588457.1 DUF2238 domain-containing protein [Rhodohalobacter sulfatireducens]
MDKLGQESFNLRVKNLDIFWSLNLFLFLWMCQFAYVGRFVEYRGEGNLHEFFVYALLIIIALGFGWKYFRQFQVPSYILVLVQVGILIHFSGGLLEAGGERLYDNTIFGIRFDKYVHLVNAFIAAIIINYILFLFDVQVPRFKYLFVIFIVLGLGAIIEIIEYLVMLTVPGNGVGDYHNNMQDLLANLVGCLLFFVLLKFKNRSS